MDSLDLKHFKKVGMSKTHTTFQHPDGHIIQIAHGHPSVDTKMKNQLKKLPTTEVKHLAEGTEEPIQAETPMKGSEGLSKHSLLSPLQKVYNTEAQAHGVMDQFSSAGESPQSLDPMIFRQARQSLASQTPIDDTSDQIEAATAQNNMRQQMGMSSVPVPASKTSQEPLPQNPTLPQPFNQQQDSDPYGAGAALETYKQGIAGQQTGIMNEALARDVQGVAESKIANQSAATLSRMQADYEKHYNTLEAERQAHMHDIQNNLINPNHYLGSMNGEQKALTAVGLILGGMGGGTGENPASKFLNQQIDNDIKAQTSNLGARENLLSANLRQFGNLKDATDMTKVMLMDRNKLRFEQAASAAKGPLARSIAQQEIGKIDQQSASILGQMSARKAALTGDNSNNIPLATKVQYAFPEPKERDKAMAEVGTIDKTMALHKAIDEISTKMSKLQTVGSRLGNPIQSMQQIKALGAQLTPLLIDINPSKRLTHESAEMEIRPFLQNFFTGKSTAEELNQGLHSLTDTLAAKTPTLDSMPGFKKPKYVHTSPMTNTIKR